MSSWSWCDPKDTEGGWSWCDRPVSKKREEHSEEEYWWGEDFGCDV